MTTPQEPWRRWLLALQRHSAILVLPGHIEPADMPDLCSRLHVLASTAEPPVVVCDAAALADPNCVDVDALARLQLTARRLGTRISLMRASEKLYDLLDFAGLSAVLPAETSALEPPRQTE